MGMGHVRRCLSLGEELRARGWPVCIVTAQPGVGTEAMAAHADIDLVAVAGPAGAADDADALLAGWDRRAVVVVDGYHFSTEFFERLERVDRPFVVIDDTGRTAATTPALIVDQNPSAAPDQYARFSDQTARLLGLDYALLRQSIRAQGRSGPDGGPPRHQAGSVLVSMGGSDPEGLSVPIAELLADLDIPTRITLGPAMVDADKVARRLASLRGVEIASPASFETDLARAGVAVVGAGTTLWEGAHLGTPLVAVVVAENQEPPAGAAARLGFVEVVDARPGAAGPAAVDEIGGVVSRLLGDDDRRAALGRRGRAAVDGQGATRVANALANLIATREA